MNKEEKIVGQCKSSVSKELEVVRKLQHCGVKEYRIALEKVEQIILKYEQINNANPSEALSLIKRKPYECADAIHYVTINKIYPRMLNYKNYCMSIKNKLNEDEFNLIMEVFLNVRGVK